MEKNIIVKAAGLIIHSRRVLMCRKRGEDFYITPGGKIEEGESAREALSRELDEELGVRIVSCSKFGTFEGPHAFKENTLVRMETFLVEILDTPSPQAEIEELHWLSSNFAAENIKLSRINIDSVVPSLLEKGLID